MNRKRVWRYYCDFCKKGGCSGGHMARHENGCTLNPARECGVCRVMELEDVQALLFLKAFCKAKATAGDSIDGNPDDSSLWLNGDAVKELREMAGGCPVCMLAALRQSDVYVERQHFDFKPELKGLWADHNEAQHAYGY